MPYISKELRAEIDPLIEQLADKVFNKCDNADSPWTEAAGMLNYCMTRLVVLFLPRKFNYWQIALMTGIIENVKQELYRKLASPYEDNKCELNGEVYED